MGKSREFFKKIKDTKKTFHAKMDTIKDKDGKDQIETEEIRKRQQEHTEELYKKGLNDHFGKTMMVWSLIQSMEKQTGSKQEKEYVKDVYCHPAYLTYMQSTS